MLFAMDKDVKICFAEALTGYIIASFIIVSLFCIRHIMLGRKK